jgi:predicted DNA-binding antitoxin AbrB/MazE fold protein
MTLTVEATYENGVLKLAKPLPVKEHTKVQITVQAAGNWVDATAGMMGWTGTSEELAYLALDPELDPQESA